MVTDSNNKNSTNNGNTLSIETDKQNNIVSVVYQTSAFS